MVVESDLNAWCSCWLVCPRSTVLGVVEGRSLEVHVEVTPVGPQLGLAPVGQTGAAHDETPPVVDALRHLGLTVGGVVDVHRGVLVDGGDHLGRALVGGGGRCRGWRSYLKSLTAPQPPADS